MFPFEIHSHTAEHSACSVMPAQELFERCIELGLAGVVVTDHHFQWPLAELEAIARRVSDKQLTVLSAYEVTTADPETGGHAGDLLIFGAPEKAAPMKIRTPYNEACRRGREQGALIISAHPYRQGMGAGDRVYSMDIDGIEVYNQNHSQRDVLRARQAVLRRGYLGVAGSDAHRRIQVGQFVMRFTRPVATMQEFMARLRAREYSMQSNRPDIS